MKKLILVSTLLVTMLSCSDNVETCKCETYEWSKVESMYNNGTHYKGEWVKGNLVGTSTDCDTNYVTADLKATPWVYVGMGITSSTWTKTMTTCKK